MQRFPGLTATWEQAAGKTIEAVAPMPTKTGAAVLIFTDGSFAVAPPLALEPWELAEGLTVARCSRLQKDFIHARATVALSGTSPGF